MDASAHPAIPDAGFADPVGDAQRCFRRVLDAMAHPGRIATAGGVTAPPPLDVATAAVLLTLVDHETPLWLDPAAAAARPWIAFHCGAQEMTEIGGAAFALALSWPGLAALHAGTHEEPETSATLICQVEALGRGASWRLSGPGLREPAVLAVTGLPADFAAVWARNHALFPRGIDLILCAGDRLMALPRTVSIEEV